MMSAADEMNLIDNMMTENEEAEGEWMITLRNYLYNEHGK